MFAWIGYILCSYLAADLLAGFWHWLEDRYFDVTWPIIGEYIAKPNTLHHEQPTAFLFQSYWSRNWTTILPAAVGLALSLIYWPALSLVFVFVSQANEIHAWAHMKGKVHPWIATLQDTGLFQSPKHHGQHHRSPFDIRFCVMSDWLNPLLDQLMFWTALESILKVVGIDPKPA